MARGGPCPYPLCVRPGNLLSTSLLFATLFAANHAIGAPPAPRHPTALQLGLARSVGAPNDGQLVAGAHLDPSAIIRIVPSFANEDYRWGLPLLVQLIQRAALRVSQEFPNAVLTVGDISRRSGGELREHLSHQSGRDADIGFYVSDASGAQTLTSRFIEFDGDGLSREMPGARFDDARNWALVEALVSDRDAKVEYIFVSSLLRARLIREALRQRAPLSARIKAARVMREPGTSTAHADHFHVRIACPRNQNGVCEPYPRVRSRSARRAQRPSAKRR